MRNVFYRGSALSFITFFCGKEPCDFCFKSYKNEKKIILLLKQVLKLSMHYITLQKSLKRQNKKKSSLQLHNAQQSSK